VSNSPLLAWLLLAVPVTSGVCLAAAGRLVNRAAPAVAVAVAAVTVGLAVDAAVVRPRGSVALFARISAAVGIDGLSAVMVVTVSVVTFAVFVFAAGEFDGSDNLGRFFGLMLVFAGAMLLTVTATTLALLLMGWEVMGATSYALIGFWWREPQRVAAANTAFLTTRAADLGLYVAAGAAVAGGVGSLALAQLPEATSPWRNVLTVGIVLAALGKSAQLPFSFWLSRAMQGPSAVSALLHSATMVAAGAYLLLRSHRLLEASRWAAPTVAWVGALTALVLGLVAVAQRDLKQLLAASTCAQIGFMVLAAGAGGVTGGVMQLVAHAAVKSLLFIAAGAWLAVLGTKQLSGLRGAARRYPLVGVTFTVGAFTLAGLPPGSLWVTKDELLAAALHRSPGLYAVGLAAAVVSAVYSVKAVWYVWQPEPVDAAGGYDTENQGTRRVTRSMTGPLAGLAAMAGTLGVLGIPAVAQSLRRTLGTTGEPGSRGWQLVLSALLALTAGAATWWWADRPVPIRMLAPLGRALRNWLYLERSARRLFVAPTLAVAGWLATFDDKVLDRAVTGLARETVTLARAAGRFDDGGFDGVVRAVAGGARRLGRLARRPQTGQLHTYYAQAAAGFALLAIVFVFVR
jgi:NADH-quinone oxidoreductase subunit L